MSKSKSSGGAVVIIINEKIIGNQSLFKKITQYLAVSAVVEEIIRFTPFRTK